MTPEELNLLWSEPAHWTRTGLYRCAADPRVVVLKRSGGGCTVNVAHPRAWLVFAAVVCFALIPVVAKLLLGARAPDWLAATLLWPIFVAAALTAWIGRRKPTVVLR